MIKRVLKNKRGDGYVDVCIGVVVFVIILVVGINIFGFISLKADMEHIADELLDTATYTGCFGTDYNNVREALKDEYFDFEDSPGANAYFNVTYKRVQLGDVMWVEISKDAYIRGIGNFKIPVTLTVKRSGISEKYWK